MVGVEGVEEQRYQRMNLMDPFLLPHAARTGKNCPVALSRAAGFVRRDVPLMIAGGWRPELLHVKKEMMQRGLRQENRFKGHVSFILVGYVSPFRVQCTLVMIPRYWWLKIDPYRPWTP